MNLFEFNQSLMNAVLLCQVWSKAIELNKDTVSIDSEKKANYLVTNLKKTNLEKLELELARDYILENLSTIDELINLSCHECKLLEPPTK